MLNNLIRVFFALIILLLFGCAQPARQSQGFMIGSATSKNLFLDSSQFYNKRVKLRLRNSSGDPSADTSRLRASIESGLRSAGYDLSESDFGILLDINLFSFQTIVSSQVRSNSGLGALVGGVAGYELAKGSGGVGAGSGTILGAIVGNSIEDIIRTSSSSSSFIALAEVNIGVVKKNTKSTDSLLIGGSAIEDRNNANSSSFANFQLRESLKVAVYAGDTSEKRQQTINSIVDRLGNILANLL